MAKRFDEIKLLHSDEDYRTLGYLMGLSSTVEDTLNREWLPDTEKIRRIQAALKDAHNWIEKNGR